MARLINLNTYDPLLLKMNSTFNRRSLLQKHLQIYEDSNIKIKIEFYLNEGDAEFILKLEAKNCINDIIFHQLSSSFETIKIGFEKSSFKSLKRRA